MSPKVPTKECQPPFRGLGTQSENAPLQSKWEELKTEIWGRENTWKGPLGIVLLQEWLVTASPTGGCSQDPECSHL